MSNGLRATGGERTIGATGVSYAAFAAAHPARFPAPMVEHARDPHEFEYWAHLIQYAFDDLDDPRTISPLSGSLSATEEATVRRYIAKAELLADRTVLNLAVTLSVEQVPGGGQVATPSLPHREAIDGFTMPFRQFYANDEEASLHVVRGTLMPRALAASDGDMQPRVDAVIRWTKAIGSARSRMLDHLVLDKLIDNGEYVASAAETAWIPDRDNPEQVISGYFYGDDVHWSSRRGHAAMLDARSPADDAYYRFRYLIATTGLAHLYLGFATLLQRVMPV